MNLGLLRELTQKFPNWAEIYIDEIYSWDGVNISVSANKEELEVLEERIKENGKEIDKLEEDNRLLSKDNGALEAKIESISGYFSKLTNERGETFKELLERNEWQAEEITNYKKALNEWRKKCVDLEQEITKLRTRKNKVLVTRDLKTGLLVTEFEGVEYILNKK